MSLRSQLSHTFILLSRSFSLSLILALVETHWVLHPVLFALHLNRVATHMVTDKNQIPSNNSTSGGHTRQDKTRQHLSRVFRNVFHSEGVFLFRLIGPALDRIL